MTKDKILAALPTLSRGDLSAIRAVAGKLLGDLTTNEPVTPDMTPIGWLHDALNMVIGSFSHTLSRDADRAFHKTAPTAIAFMHHHFDTALNNKTTAVALMRYLLLLLSADLRRMKVPVTKLTVAQNLHRLGEVFNDAFPGYGDKKAAALVMASIIRGK